MPLRVLHVITALETGGAETALYGLLRGMDEQFSGRLEHQVISLVRPGYMGEKIESLGVAVSHLDMRRGRPTPGALLRLSGMLQHHRPHVLQTWLYHADLVGLLSSWLAVNLSIPVVWNLRCAFMDFSKYPKTTAWTAKACAKLSRYPAAIVANSRAAINYHQQLGYHPRRVEVIPNGVDTNRFAPDLDARARLRRELGLAPQTLLAGMAGRFDPMKDVPTLLQALALVPDLQLMLCGQGMDRENEALAGLIQAQGGSERVHLAGHRTDLERILPGLDVYVSSSLGESFPNVVAEALASGVPVAATDVGASAGIVGHEGRIVPPGQPELLAAGLNELVSMSSDERAALGARGRERMKLGYSWAACVGRYAGLYEDIGQA